MLKKEGDVENADNDDGVIYTKKDAAESYATYPIN